MTSTTAPDAMDYGNNRDWGLGLAAGITMILISILMFTVPAAAGLAVTVLLGWIVLASGIIGIVAGIAHRREGGLWVNLILGLLAVGAGLLLIFRPLAGTVTLATILVLWLIVDGLIGTIFSLVLRGPDWGWWLASSLVSLVLGVVLFGTLPVGSFWILGTFLAVALLFRGIALVVISLELRRRTREA